MKTLQKCLNYLCQKESYRMLKEWRYDTQDPFPGDSDPNSDQDSLYLDDIAKGVINNISQELNVSKKKKKKKTRR